MNVMAARWARLYRGTPAELSIEPAIAELGVPYRNNYPGFLYGFRYFPDFYLPTLKLVIEVDDPSHEQEDKRVADAIRTFELNMRGLKVVRCTNEEALTNPRAAVRRMLREVGLFPLPERLPSLASSLPKPTRLHPKDRDSGREAKDRRTRKRPRR